jgi:hypothetical protein
MEIAGVGPIRLTKKCEAFARRIHNVDASAIVSGTSAFGHSYFERFAEVWALACGRLSDASVGAELALQAQRGLELLLAPFPFDGM